MKIVHITTYTTGGAGIACLRLHNALLQQGIDSSVLCLKKEHCHSPKVFVFPDKSLFRKLLSKAGIWKMTRHRHFETMMRLQKKAKTNFYYSFPNTEYDLLKHPLIQQADIIHLHWVAGLLDYLSFFRKINKPVVWTFHDYNAMLGGLHSPIKGLQSIIEPYENKIIKTKKIAYSYIKNLTIICISSQIKQTVENFPPLKHARKVLIHNGVESSVFYPKESQTTIKKRHGIADNTKILLFISHTLCARLKGFYLIIEAYKKLPDSNCILLLIGNLIGNEKIECKKPFIHIESISDHHILADYYSAADIFVMPSLFETFAQTPIEALMCGCPTIMTPVSGAEDIMNEKNGIIAEKFSSEAICEAIEIVFSKKLDRSQIASTTKERFSIDKIAKESAELYQTILASSKCSKA